MADSSRIRKDKRSFLKHRTRSGFQPNRSAALEGASSDGARVKGKGKAGFKVGPSHAPDGAYLGKAKKIKADLIQKAKVKQRYYKEQRKQQSSPAHDSILQEQRDEGRFAPESDQSNEPLHLVTSGKISRRGNNAHAQMEALQEQKKEQAKIAEKEAQRLIQGGVTHRMEKKTVPSPSGETSLSREEQAKKRQRRQEHYHRQSGSRIGRQRGQPNLGARVDLLLDKIKQS